MAMIQDLFPKLSYCSKKINIKYNIATCLECSFIYIYLIIKMDFNFYV